MKRMMTTIVAGALAASLGAHAAIAQDTAAGKPVAGVDQWASAKAVIRDSRLEGMKAVLKLTPGQEKYWTPFETAVRDSFALYDQMMAATRQAITKDDPVQILDMLSDDASQRATRTKKIADAAKPLYDSLNPSQKRIFGPLMLTLTVEPMAAARQAQRMRQQLMRRWTRAKGQK